jgi:hypothetical protein
VGEPGDPGGGTGDQTEALPVVVVVGESGGGGGGDGGTSGGATTVTATAVPALASDVSTGSGGITASAGPGMGVSLFEAAEKKSL